MPRQRRKSSQSGVYWPEELSRDYELSPIRDLQTILSPVPHGGIEVNLMTTTVIVARTDTKVWSYHRPIVFACATVVLSRHCIEIQSEHAQQELFKQKPKS